MVILSLRGRWSWRAWGRRWLWADGENAWFRGMGEERLLWG